MECVLQEENTAETQYTPLPHHTASFGSTVAISFSQEHAADARLTGRTVPPLLQQSQQPTTGRLCAALPIPRCRCCAADLRARFEHYSSVPLRR